MIDASWGDPVEDGGEVAYYGLSEWWRTALTADERSRIEERHRPFGLGGEGRSSLTSGAVYEIRGPMASPATWVSQLVRNLTRNPEDETIRRKLLGLLDELLRREARPLARHFALAAVIEERLRDARRDPEAREAAMEACRESVRLAPEAARAFMADGAGALPRHAAYQRLASLLAENGDHDEAIRLCEEARDAGWGRDWDQRIERLRRARERRRGGG